MITKLYSKIVRRVRAFTLLETLVAIGILMTAIVGPLTIAMMGLESSLVSSNQITATYLAQDALEYIRAKRDSNTLDNQGWLSGLNNCISADGSATCYVETYTTAAPTSCSGACPALYYGNGSPASTLYGTYNYDNYGAVSKFTRTISIVCDDPSHSCQSSREASTTAVVSWTDNSATRSVTLHENLFNWQ